MADRQSQTQDLISGIQQVGIGVPDADAAFLWYNKNLGLDVPVFDDVAEAKLMTKYTLGNIRQRRAILAVNMAGGGGAEIWESRRPLPLAAQVEPKIGDLGIFAVKIKCQDIEKYAAESGNAIVKTPEGQPAVWLKDLYGNQLQVVEDESWFKPKQSNTGGVLGAVIGVSNMDKAIKLYRDTLGIDQVIYDVEGTFGDLKELGAEKKKFRRVLLRKEKSKLGAFTNLFGNIEIELVQTLDDQVNVIFEGRSWGDLGYIHLCFDAIDMEKLKAKCESNGFPFVVDSSNTFDMGEAGGRFSYIEDPDGTLIEFVETHKVPILKKIGWYLNLKKRKTQNPLPNWMVSTIGWGRVKLSDK